MGLFRGRKAKTLVAVVKLGVEGAQERIAKNPERTDLRREIETNESGETSGLTELAKLHNVLLGAHDELLTRDSDDQIRQGGDDRAVDSGLAVGTGQVVADSLECFENGLISGVVGEQVLGVGQHGGAERAVGASGAQIDRGTHLSKHRGQ